MKTLSSLVVVALLGCAVAVAGPNAVKVSPPYAAPDVQGVDQDGKAVNFADVYKSSPYVAVYFYPKADTPGCTRQGCSIRDAHEDLSKLGVKVIGVSHDTVAEEKAFSDKFKFPFTLVGDTDSKIIQAFKVAQSPKGFANRECFLIKNGQVVWHDPKASTDKQAADLKQAIESLK